MMLRRICCLTLMVSNFAMLGRAEGSLGGLTGVISDPTGAMVAGAIALEVADTGPGIAVEDQSCIFDPFVQLGSQRSQKGTGLGLTITKQFVELMGGTIQVESAPGDGSRFRVQLPVERAEDWEVQPANTEGEQIAGLEPGQPDWRVLIVDDEPANWLLLQRLLEDAGFMVHVAANGQQGVEMFESWRPHFIWMDLRMPVMDGREATRRIRALPGGREVKIAAVTASAFISERDEVLEAGMDDFIRKPFRHSEIFDCMARHLGLRYRFVATAPAPAESTAAAFLPEQLALLPEGLRAQLKDSVTSLDVERITLVIRHISEQDGTLGSALARLADRLSFSAILQALEICSQTTSIEAGP